MLLSLRYWDKIVLLAGCEIFVSYFLSTSSTLTLFPILPNLVMATYVTKLEEFTGLIGQDKLTVVDFTATWCGPCRNISPFYDELVPKYPDVAFLKVDVDDAQEIAGAQGVRAMPTFKFFHKGAELETLQGANPAKLEELVKMHKTAASTDAAFGGQGHTMGTAGSAADAAAARLARFGAPAAIPAAAGKASNVGNAAEEDEDEALAKAIALSMEAGDTLASPAAAGSTAKEEKATEGGDKMDVEEEGKDEEEGGDPNELVPLPVNADLLKEMVAMGFSDIRARKGLHFGGSVDGAVNWLDENSSQPNIDDEFLVRRGDINKKPLSPEETAIKMQEYKLLAKRRREERAAQEKKEEVRREKERRERDQKSQVTQTEREAMQRKRDAEKIRKEKADAKAEKARILAEIAHDKAVRAKNKGVLPSVLGVDGYNPSAIQYDQNGPGGNKSSAGGDLPKQPSAASSANPVTAPAAMTVEEMVEKSISNLLRYKTRGDGGNALKLLCLFVKNVAEKPTEVKYRSISTESNAYKTKIAGFVGGASLLKALGFEKKEEGKLVLNVPDEDTASFVPLFLDTLTKLSAAANIFAQENPV